MISPGAVKIASLAALAALSMYLEWPQLLSLGIWGVFAASLIAVRDEHKQAIVNVDPGLSIQLMDPQEENERESKV